MFREEFLCLNGFPVLDTAKVRENRQLANATFFLQPAYLIDHFFRRSDEANFLLYDIIVSQLCQTFQGSAGIKLVTLCDQFLHREILKYTQSPLNMQELRRDR